MNLSHNKSFRNSTDPNHAENNNHGSNSFVTVYRYHGPTLRESQKDLRTKRRKRNRKQGTVTATTTTTAEAQLHGGGDEVLEHASSVFSFGEALKRHRFVAFFVVQGYSTVDARHKETHRYYSAHTLGLRALLATEYHDVLTTLVLDVGNNNNNSYLDATAFCDEETGEATASYCGNNSNNDNNTPSFPFCRGTGFAVVPCGGGGGSTRRNTTPTILALLNVSKIPSVVVLDATTGRIVSRDAIPSLERNDAHTVVNSWQSSGTKQSQRGTCCCCCCRGSSCTIQ